MGVLEQIFTASMLFVILMKVAPLLLAAIGGAFTQQGNILNIGLEGMMLIGAFTSIAVGSATGSALVGVGAAVAAALVLALIYAFATLWLKADFIVVGIGVNLLAAGLSVFLLQVFYGNPGVTPPSASIRLPRISLGPLAEVPVIGPALHNQTALVWLALLAVPVASIVLYRTRYGVHLRAVGEDEAAAEAAGIGVRRVKFQSILISGVLCGVAGAQLAMATLGSFTANMTSGRGFIAVAALTFGLAKPVRTMVAAFIFGAADAIADQLGIAGFNSNLALMTPYIITIIALVLVGIRFHKIRSKAPSATPAPQTA
ncbi:ABC transporter permease [Cellulomonas chengniuliangii]|uniref:ABC transporter permease n=1 Tax=Cellulomonas chengniuliangii TaxID=2968084 RepID=A0ABY5L4C8_9CELL|nr:ABC transporter permease [Cellulomonas chengniuliangii]MCC2307800.1 ABC transporter permease [Cellulomonas chengniuliangii]UUI75443.1 ABC transporter permease [Cellulomonas chengniuliangii]